MVEPNASLDNEISSSELVVDGANELIVDGASELIVDGTSELVVGRAIELEGVTDEATGVLEVLIEAVGRGEADVVILVLADTAVVESMLEEVIELSVAAEELIATEEVGTELVVAIEVERAGTEGEEVVTKVGAAVCGANIAGAVGVLVETGAAGTETGAAIEKVG